MKAKKGIFPLTLVAMAVTSATSFVSIAAQAEEYTSAQEKMVVVSSRTPKAISDIPGTVWYVDSEQIEQEYRAGKTLGEILAATIPSLDVSSGSRSNYGQNLRGRKMLVMIDGVSLQSSRQISRQLEAIDPFNIDRIEVLSGASSLYGGGAVGGVINIVTKKAESDELQFESYVGSTSGLNGSEDLDYKLGQSIAGGNDKVQARAAVVYTETKALYDGNGDMVVPDTSQGSLQYNTTLDAVTTIGVNVSETQSLNVLLQYYDSQQDSPYGVYRDASGGYVDFREGFESDRQQGTERAMLSVTYSDSDFLNHQAIAELSYRKEDHTFSPYYSARDDLTSSSQHETDVFSAKLALSKDFGELSLVYGIDGYIDNYESNQAYYAQSNGGLVNKIYTYSGRYPGVKVGSLAGFIQGDYQISEDWSIQGGYRYQYLNNKIEDFVGYTQQKQIVKGNGTSADAVPGGETDYKVHLFNIGTIYHLSAESQVWANFSQGFDLADPAKYYGQGTYDSAPDANGHWNLNQSINVDDSKMEGIKTDSFEVGYRTDLDSLSFQGAAYYTQSNNSIKYDRKTLLIAAVDDETRVYGAEGLVSYWVNDNIEVGMSGHYVVSKIKQKGNWEDIQAKSASTSKANAWIGWSDSDLSAKLTSQTMFDYEDGEQEKLDGYTILGLQGSYELPVGSLGFGVQNLLDEDYTTLWGQRAQMFYGETPEFDFKGRGRTYTLNYQISY